MKQFISIKCIVLLGAVLFGVTNSLAQAQHHVKHRTYYLTQADTVKMLIVKRGSRIRISLPDHVDGGFRFDTIKYDHTILQLQMHREKAPPVGSPLGASGAGIWQFVAVKKGITEVSLTATRPWSGGGTVFLFKNVVKVK